ncbi:uncharacterized protein LOC114588794 [Podarcis muralis]
MAIRLPPPFSQGAHRGTPPKNVRRPTAARPVPSPHSGRAALRLRRRSDAHARDLGGCSQLPLLSLLPCAQGCFFPPPSPPTTESSGPRPPPPAKGLGRQCACAATRRLRRERRRSFARLLRKEGQGDKRWGLEQACCLFGDLLIDFSTPLERSRIRCLRRLFRRCHRVAPQPDTEQPVAPVLLRFSIPGPELLEDEQVYLLGVIRSCQAAELRGLRSLKCSKQETAQAILDILGPLEHFRDCPLTLALALEALLQLSTMRPKFSCDMISAILHRTLEAVLKGATEEEEKREELKRHFQLLLGILLMESPNPGTLLHLLSVSAPMASGVVLGLLFPPSLTQWTALFLGHRACLAPNLVQDQSWQTLMVQNCQGLRGGGSGGRLGPDWPLTLRRSFLL